MEQRPVETIDEYIEQYDGDAKQKMLELKKLIKELAPEATERMSWRMPTFYLNGNLVHFAAHAKHIGFYPGAEGVEAFLPRLSGLKYSKGAIQLPLGEPLPIALIRDIVAFRVQQQRI